MTMAKPGSNLGARVLLVVGFVAAQLERIPPLHVRVRAGDLPRVHDPRTTANMIAVLGILAALLLITASLLLDNDRPAIGRVGRRIAFLAFMPIVVFVVLPRVL